MTSPTTQELLTVKSKEQDISKDDHVKEYIGRWAYECGIPFHAFEMDNFKIILDTVGKSGCGLQPSCICKNMHKS
ncbi:hypothetical protein LXL04_017218 [Taraxacum kok-saghyz]